MDNTKVKLKFYGFLICTVILILGLDLPISNAQTSLNNSEILSENITEGDVSDGPVFMNQNNLYDMVYIAKFVCGTISGSEGPLRPGHYDTDISIYNRQLFSTSVLWYAVYNNEVSSSLLKNLDSDKSFNIVCNDVFSLNRNLSKFAEGFIIIKPQQLGSSFNSDEQPFGNSPLDVQVFYTANALENLPKELVVDKYSLKILKDPSNKIPSHLLNETLEISLDSNLNQIYDPKSRLLSVISDTYGLSTSESSLITFSYNIIDSAVGVMIDDHAISLSRITPSYTYIR